MKTDTHPIVGVWRVQTKGAPFAYHMFTFHSDGTMLQSNPPEGNKDTSDTSGMGVWEDKQDQVMFCFEEYRLDFKTGEVTRGVIAGTFRVSVDTFAGDCAFNVYDADSGEHKHGPHAATLQGERVRLQ